MTKFNFPHTSFLLCSILLSGVVYTTAQQAALATNSSSTPYFQSVALKAGEKRKLDFSVRVVGSVKGRVFSDADAAGLPGGGEPDGIGGVRVSLRSKDPGFENFVIEQFTDTSGAYSFVDLRPGKYFVEIDPKNLPAKYRNPAVNDSPVKVQPSQNSNIDILLVAQRVLSGFVYIDRDNDGQFKSGSDLPVAGALITVGGHLAVSDATGAYTLVDLPAGRIGLLVSWPKKAINTHVVLDLDGGPVTNRVVNIPLYP